MFCRSTIYNSKVTSMLDNLYELNDIGVNIFRLDFTLEDAEITKEVVQAYIEVLKNNYRLGSKAQKLYSKLEQIGVGAGHFYKGVE